MRPIIAVALAATFLANVQGPATAALLDGGALASVAVTGSVADPDGPSPRFGLSSILNQVATTVSKVATSISPPSFGPFGSTPFGSSVSTSVPDPNNVIVSPGQTVVFTISGTLESAAPGTGAGTGTGGGTGAGTGGGNAIDVLDIFDANLTYVSDTGNCSVVTLASIPGGAPTPSVQPANVGGFLSCNPIQFPQTSYSFTVTFTVNANAPPHTEPNFNVACVENTAQVNNFNLCDSVAGTVIPIGPPPIPPPPPILPPPPPPPLLPPPPMAPPSMARAPMPEVPVIPEADSLLLLVGGLAALGGLAAFRVARRRHEDEL